MLDLSIFTFCCDLKKKKPPLPDFSQNISHGKLALFLSITKGKQFNIKFVWVPFSSTFTSFHIPRDTNMRKRYQSKIICLPEFQLSQSQHFVRFMHSNECHFCFDTDMESKYVH